MAYVSDVVFSLLIIASGVFAAGTLGFGIAWVRARERAIRAERGLAQALPGDSRFERLEHAVDTIAVEVERISEGQRFLTRVLAERADPQGIPAQSASVVTPR